MKKYKIKKNDKVFILTGKEKGKTGVVKEIITKNDRAIIEGLNKVICFNKKTKEGMTTKEASIHISNLAHIDPVQNVPTRVKIVISGDVKQIVAKKSNKVIR